MQPVLQGGWPGGERLLEALQSPATGGSEFASVNQRVVAELRERGGSRRSDVADESGEVAKTEQEAQERQRHDELARFAEAKPCAVSQQNLAQADGFRTGGVECCATGLGARGKTGDAAGEIVERDRLEALASLPWQRQHEREPGEPPHQRRAAIGAASDHQRGLHDQPIGIEAAERGVGLGLGPRIGSGNRDLCAYRGDMHDAANP